MGRGGSGKQLVALEDGQRLAFADSKPAPALVIAGSGIGNLTVIDPFKAIHERINQQIKLPGSFARFLNPTAFPVQSVSDRTIQLQDSAQFFYCPPCPRFQESGW